MHFQEACVIVNIKFIVLKFALNGEAATLDIRCSILLYNVRCTLMGCLWVKLECLHFWCICCVTQLVYVASEFCGVAIELYVPDLRLTHYDFQSLIDVEALLEG